MATANIDISILEGFAVAVDREAYLNELVPGTTEHFVCTWFLAEQTGYPEKLQAGLDAYTSANPYAQETTVYRNRRKLISLSDDASAIPDDLISWLKSELHADFTHCKRDLGGDSVDTTPSRPTAAELSALEEDALIGRALASEYYESSFLSNIDTATFLHEHPRVISAMRNNSVKLYYYLQKGLGFPDTMSTGELVQAVKSVLEDAGFRSSYGAGAFENILEKNYANVSLSFLFSLGEGLPSLRSRIAWGGAVLARLAPQAGVDLRRETAARGEYLQKVLEFVQPLPPQYNPVRLAVLYYLLKDKWTGPESLKAHAALVEQYLQIPRQASRFNEQSARYFAAMDNWYELVSQCVVVTVGQTNIASRIDGTSSSLDLSTVFALPIPSVSDDEELINEALTQIFAAAPQESFAPWDSYVNVKLLRTLQAEAKLLRGPDAEREPAKPWPTALSGGASALASLRDRVEIAINSCNNEFLAAGPSPYSLSFRVKGVKSVSLRVFEINSTAYYLDKFAEIPTDLELDGLLPHTIIDVPVESEEVAAGRVWSPLSVYFKTIPIAAAQSCTRGVFVVDVTGGGKSVRAVIRKGALRFIERRTVAGHLITVLDENNVPVPANRVSVTVGARKYTPKANDSDMPQILVPYAASTSRTPLLLTVEDDTESALGAWSFSSLVASWEHASEHYTLEAGFFIDREALVRDNYSAKLLVRPKLLLHGVQAAPLGALQNVTLQITSTDADNSSSTKVIKPFELNADGESCAVFAVPPNLRRLEAKLSADIEIMADGSKRSLSASHQVALNKIHDGGATRDVYLRYVEDEGYCVYLLGKNGEAVPNARLSVSLQHPLIKVNLSSYFTLKTDSEGRIVLGPLRGFRSITVSGIPSQSGGASSSMTAVFDLPLDTVTYPRLIHAVASLPGREQSPIQAALPYRPASDGFVMSRSHVRLQEIRPQPAGANSAQSGGPLPDPIRESSRYLPVQDLLLTDDLLSKYLTFKHEDAQLLVHNLPPGQYKLTVKCPYPGAVSSAAPIVIQVLPSSGTVVVGQHLANGHTVLQAHVSSVISNPSDPTALSVVTRCPLQIAKVFVDGSGPEARLKVRVTGGSSGPGAAKGKDVRVHINATYFIPSWNAGNSLDKIAEASLTATRWAAVRSRYLPARVIGEEIKYVMDRQQILRGGAGPRPGNSLPRPTLLLNAWSHGPVETGSQDAATGGAYDRYMDSNGPLGGAAYRQAASSAGPSYGAGEHCSFTTLDFLHHPSTLLHNLTVGSDGTVEVPLQQVLPGLHAAKQLGDFQVTVVAVDNASIACTNATLSSAALSSAPYNHAAVATFKNLTDANSKSLDMNTHVIQTSKISCLATAGASVELAASATQTKVETYGSIDRVFSLFCAMSSNAQLVADWSWLTSWPELSIKDKCSKYSKYVCHELNVWTLFKDSEFFTTVVVPYIACKRAKTFVDHFLLSHDLTAYTSPEVFAQLNLFEKALLCSRCEPGLASELVARIRDPVENLPLTAEQKEAVFKAALASNALDGATPTGASLQSLLTRAERERAPPPKPVAAPQSRNAIPMDNDSAKRKMKKEVAHLLKRSEQLEELVASASCESEAPEKRRSAVRGMFGKKLAPSGVAYAIAPSLSLSSAARPLAARAMADMASAESLRYSSYQDEDESSDLCDDDGDDEDLDRREEARESALYRPLDKTEEYAETHYYRIRSDLDNALIISSNPFWADFAQYCANITVSRTGTAAELARKIKATPFVSANFGWVSSNAFQHNAFLNELLLALAVLGLPFERGVAPPQPPQVSILPGNAKVRFEAAGTPLVLFHQDLSVSVDEAASSILCGQSYFDPEDREVVHRGTTREKYLPKVDSSTGIPSYEMVMGKVYGCLVVVTNVASYRQQLDVLVHIPQGSLPVRSGFVVKTRSMTLAPFTTQRFEYFFYVPNSGSYHHYPIQISAEGKLLAYGSVTAIEAVSRVQIKDTTSWLWVSQMGTLDEVIDYISKANLREVDLNLLLWRCNDDVAAFKRIVSVLETRFAFNTNVWSYGIKYGERCKIKQLLAHPTSLSNLTHSLLVLPVLKSDLLSVGGESGVGEERKEAADAQRVMSPMLGAYDPHSMAYEHFEYSPLVNARAHQLGTKRVILNKAVERQYRTLLTVLCAKAVADVSASDLLALAYFFLLQDRVNEAVDVFVRIPRPSDSALHPSPTANSPTSKSWQTLQYDYMAAYLDLFNYNPDGPIFAYAVAKAVVAKYNDYPIPKWCARFLEIKAQLEEAAGDASTSGRTSAAIGTGLSHEEQAVSKELSREAAMSKAASEEPTLDISVQAGSATVVYGNLKEIMFRFYSMDIEVLFSMNPFLGANKTASSPSQQTDSGNELGQFAYLRPNGLFRATLPSLPAGKTGEVKIALPEPFAKQNVMVEVLAPGTGVRKAVPYFATELAVTITQAYGRLKVTHSKTSAPQPRVYVKVFFRKFPGDKGTFYKDGYTDARGVFDYSSISTDELSKTERFAILVVSQEFGACIREVAPPAS